MEEDIAVSSSTWRTSNWWQSVLFPLGFFLGLSEVIVRLAQGTGAVDAIWPHAVRSLEWTVVLRSSTEQTLILFMAVPALGYVVNRWKSEHEKERGINDGLMVLLGLVSGLIAIHFVMDVFYL